MALGRPAPEVRPIVVLRALGLGDLLAAVPALRGLRRATEGHRILLAGPAALAPVAAWSGAVDEVVDTAPLGALDPVLRGAELAVNLHGRGPESTQTLVATAPRRLIAFDAETWDAAEHERARWCRLLVEHGIPADPEDLHLEVPDGALPAADVRGATVVHPGAARASVRWPAGRFAAVAAAERRAGWRVVVTGSAAEVDLAHAVARAAGLHDADVLAGRTNLTGLARLVAAAGRVVSGDTGIAHLAVAVGTPTVTVFGPVDPSRWGPPGRPRHRVLWAGQTGDPHADAPFPGLDAVTADAVLAALTDLDRLGLGAAGLSRERSRTAADHGGGRPGSRCPG